MGALANTTPPPDLGDAGSIFDGFLPWLRNRFGWLTEKPYGQFPDQNPFAGEHEYEDPSYPDGGPYKGEPLACYHRRKWEELDPEIRDRAVTTARAFLNVQLARELRERMKADPDCWMGEFHHGLGTVFRNDLRRSVIDRELPTGCWDDYYICAIEEALGGPEDVEDESWEATRRREEVSKERSAARFAEELRRHMEEAEDKVPGPPNPPDIPHHRPVA